MISVALLFCLVYTPRRAESLAPDLCFSVYRVALTAALDLLIIQVTFSPHQESPGVCDIVNKLLLIFFLN